MRDFKRAIILAAGQGKRMLPLTRDFAQLHLPRAGIDINGDFINKTKFTIITIEFNKSGLSFFMGVLYYLLIPY